MKNARDKLGNDTVAEMEALDEQGLKQVIFEASNAIKQVREELAANKNYQQVLEDKKALESGKREVDARQKARISYALELMEAKGK